MLSLSAQDQESLVGTALEFSDDYASAKIKKEVIVPAVCSDCPEYMKETIIKYHKAEPTGPLSAKVTLNTNFANIPKYYIYTSADKAVGYKLQQQMVKANGSIQKTYVMNTSHLPFVVKPQEFISIIESIQ